MTDSARIEARIRQAYDEWANGANFSPSAHDLVTYAAEVKKFDLKAVDAIIADHLANVVNEMQIDGADEADVAVYLNKSIDSLVSLVLPDNDPVQWLKNVREYGIAKANGMSDAADRATPGSPMPEPDRTADIRKADAEFDRKTRETYGSEFSS